MADMNLKQIEDKMREAQLQVRVREEELARLRPRRTLLEEECRTKFNCEIQDLPELIRQREDLFRRQIDKLSRLIDEANDESGTI